MANGDINQSSDLRNRIFFTIFILSVYRLGTYVPLAGIDPIALSEMMSTSQKGLLGMFNVFSGGAVQRMAIFALGIMPYISASIIVQLLTGVSDYFKNLKDQGEIGRKKITQITRYGTVFIACLQGYGVSAGLENSGNLVLNPGLNFKLMTMISLVAGTTFLMWLGEQITSRGIGNGISLIIMCGILAQFPFVLETEWPNIGDSPYRYLFLALLMFLITFIVVSVTTGIRKIPVQYAKRVVGRKVYGGQSTHIPLKILTAGVMPIIFAQALMFLPNTVASFLPDGNFFGDALRDYFAPTSIMYSVFFALLIIVFTYFYTAIAFNPVDVADNMRKQGGFIPGVRPGKATSDYIDKILTRVTLPASIFLALVAIFPTILFRAYDGDINYSLVGFFGGTSLLIIVGVALDTLQQIESHMVMRNYDGFLKSGRIRGRSRRY